MVLIIFQKSYEVKIKKLRIQKLNKFKNFKFLKKDLKYIDKFNQKSKIYSIFHLAAEAGVRRSINKPLEYVEENISNTIRVFELQKKNKIKSIFMLPQAQSTVTRVYIQLAKKFL